MIRRPPRSTRTDTLFPYTTLFRSLRVLPGGPGDTSKAKRETVVTEGRGGMLSVAGGKWTRSEEHTSELQSLMRISYAVFCLKKKKTRHNKNKPIDNNTVTIQYNDTCTQEMSRRSRVQHRIQT